MSMLIATYDDLEKYLREHNTMCRMGWQDGQWWATLVDSRRNMYEGFGSTLISALSGAIIAREES